MRGFFCCLVYSFWFSVKMLVSAFVHCYYTTIFFLPSLLPPSSSEQGSPVIHVYDGRGEDEELDTLENLHSSPITLMEVVHTLTGRLGLHTVSASPPLPSSSLFPSPPPPSPPLLLPPPPSSPLLLPLPSVSLLFPPPLLLSTHPHLPVQLALWCRGVRWWVRHAGVLGRPHPLILLS